MAAYFDGQLAVLVASPEASTVPESKMNSGRKTKQLSSGRGVEYQRSIAA